MVFGIKLLWVGVYNIEGGFNVFDFISNRNGMLFLCYNYEFVNSNIIMSVEVEGYYINYGISWVMVINFIDEGFKGWGILIYL